MEGLPSRVRGVLERVAAKYARMGVTVEGLLGPSAARPVAWARHEAEYEIYNFKRDDGSRIYSLPRIAYMLNRADHTAVHYGVHRHEERVRTGETLEAWWDGRLAHAA